MDMNDPRVVDLLVDLINTLIDKKIRNLDVKKSLAIVKSVGSGNVIAYYPNEEDSTFTVLNPNEVPCEVEDQIYVSKVCGGSIVEFRKAITFNNIYVDYENGTNAYADSNGKPYGTQERPFKTLQYAVNRLPKNTNGRTIFINYGSLDPNESVYIDNFYGGGHIYIRPISGTSITDIKYLNINGCTGVKITIANLGFTRTDFHSVFISRSSYIVLDTCKINNPSSYNGIYLIEGCHAWIIDSNIANRLNGIFAQSCCQVYSQNNNGLNTEYGIRAEYNCTVGKHGVQPSGSIGNELQLAGSEIR